MEKGMIGANIKAAREAKGLSLRALEAAITEQGRVSLSYSAIQRIEAGTRKVASDELVELAEVLDVPTAMLLGRANRSGALALAARVSEQVPVAVFEQGGQRAIEVLEAADLLARVVGPLPMPPALDLPVVKATRAGGKTLAAAVRAQLGLGSAPIADLSELIEEWFGAHVLHEPLPDSSHGFCVTGGGEAVIIVNANDNAGRQRFTLAHELCHLIVQDLDSFEVVGETGTTTGAEQRADTFAALLLAPDEGVSHAAQDRPVSATEANRLALKFGMSLRAMLNRLEDLRMIEPQESARARELGPRNLSYMSSRREQFEAYAQREGMSVPPLRLTDQAVAAYTDGRVGLGLLADVFGDHNLGRLRADLESRGFAPKALSANERASLA